jgi:hypothetical protein
MGSPATKKLRFTYNLRPVILPSRGMLRVLDLACCNLKLPRHGGDDAMSFPHLSSLRLYKCVSPIKSLQRLLRAAPSLRSLHIESHDYSFCGSNRSRLALRFPALTSLTLVEEGPRARHAVPARLHLRRAPRGAVHGIAGHQAGMGRLDPRMRVR